MNENIAQIITAAISGSHKIRVTLDPDSTSIIEQLLEIQESSTISLSEDDLGILNHIVTYCAGFDHKHPTVVITMTDQFNADWFVENIGPAIENIEAA